MTDEELLELARECAQAVIESDIQAIKQGDTMSNLWLLHARASALAEDDDDLRDLLWDAVAQELSEVKITYQLRGETALAGERRRVLIERVRAQSALNTAQRKVDDLTERLRLLGGLE